MKSGNLAKRLNVSPSTVRHWSDVYSDFLSKRGRGLREGATRRFDEEDAIILATVAHLREQGLTHEQIEEALTQGTRVEAIPQLPTEEEEEARASVGLVPVAELYRAMDRIRTLEEEIERLIHERDQERVRADTANERIAQLREELGRLRGQVLGIIVGAILLAALVGVVVALILRG